MAKELTLDVVARKNSRALSELADEFDKLSKQVDDSGKSMQKHATFSAYLDDQLVRTRVQVRELGAEFDRTGNKDVFAKLKGAQANLKSLEGIQKQLASALDKGVKDGFSDADFWFNKFSKGFTQTMADIPWAGIIFKPFASAAEAMPPEAQAGIAAAVAGAIVVSSTAIGAALNGVLLAGVGLGGVAAGVVGQLKNPEVRQAFSDLKDTASSTLAEATTSFGPVLADAAGSFTDAIKNAEPTLKAAFDDLAPHAAKLFQGLENFGAKAAPGFLEALHAAGPILDEIGKDLGDLGHTFSGFFHQLAAGSEGAKDGIHDLFILVETTVTGVGYLIRGLSDGFVLLEAFGDLAKGDVSTAGQRLAEMGSGSKVAGDAAKQTAAAIQDETFKLSDMRTAAQAAADAEARLTAQFDEQFNKLMALENADDAYQKGLNDLAQALDQNNHTLKGNSDAAIQNRQAIRDLIADAERARQAAIDHAGGVNASSDAIKAANDQYEQNLQKLEALGVQLGLRKQDLDAIVGEYDINIVTTVSGNAKNVINSDGSITIGGHSPKLIARAGGGAVTAGQPYLTGEEGPELFMPSSNGYIVPADQTASLMGGSRSSGVGGTTNIVISAADPQAAWLLQQLRIQVAAKGGNVQRVLGQGG